MFSWIKKWKIQRGPIQWLIFNYAFYLLIIIISTLFVYMRLDIVRIPSHDEVKKTDVPR